MLWTLLLAAALADLPKPEPVPMPPGDLLAEIVTSPPYGDWHRFPPKPVVSAARQMNCAFRTKMAAERERWPMTYWWRFDEAVAYAEWSYKAWDTLDDARQPWRSWWDARIKMKRLREIVGEEDYRNAVMPPAMPTWWFRELR